MRNIIFFLLVSCSAIYAQQWSGILNPVRAKDWTSTVGILGGIPNRTTPCTTAACNIVCGSGAPATCTSTGATVTTTSVQNAIQSALDNTVVRIPAGTFTISGGIEVLNKSNITIRGFGPDKTILNFTGMTGCTGYIGAFCLRGSTSVGTGQNPNIPAGNIHNVTSNPIAQGATSVTLDSTSGMSTGMIMIIDQLNDTPANLSTTGALNCDTVNVCSLEGGNGFRNGNRGMQQTVLVTNITGNTVTFTPGLYAPTWNPGKSPQIWFWGSAATTITMTGVEDLTINNQVSGGVSNFVMTTAYQVWEKNVKSLTPSRNHVWCLVAKNCEVRDSYFFGTQGAGVTNYGIEMYGAGSDHLIINNILQQVSSPMEVATSSGSVIAYNFMLQSNTTGVTGTTMWHAITAHNAGINYILFEGNVGNGLRMDTFHGTANFLTAFRNRLWGWEPGRTDNASSLRDESPNRYMVMIGNVFGKSGFHTGYETAVGGATDGNSPVYVIGGGNTNGTATVANDPLVLATLMRWGNYDTSTATVRFNSSEVPSGVSPYPNAVPASQSLPSSFFLISKPDWWGSVPWPPIGPDVTGGTMNIVNSGTWAVDSIGGHGNNTPSENCYKNVMGGTSDGSGASLTFNANQCYTTNAAPPLPSPSPASFTKISSQPTVFHGGN